MDRKIVGKMSLMIAMAKHIKSCAKELKKHNKVESRFEFGWPENNTEVRFQNKCLVVLDSLSIEELTELARNALSESCCKGFVCQDGNSCSLVLFGEPVKPFKMLQRLVKKYSGTDIGWDYFKTVYYDENDNEIDNETSYLCYNDNVCQDGIDFIRNFRTSKDVLKVKRIVGMDIEGVKPHVASLLRLIVETPHGKHKGEITLLG